MVKTLALCCFLQKRNVCKLLMGFLSCSLLFASETLKLSKAQKWMNAGRKTATTFIHLWSGFQYSAVCWNHQLIRRKGDITYLSEKSYEVSQGTKRSTNWSNQLQGAQWPMMKSNTDTSVCLPLWRNLIKGVTNRARERVLSSLTWSTPS